MTEHPEPQKAAQGIQTWIRTAARDSPWLLVSISFHVALIAVLSALYVRRFVDADVSEVTTIAVRSRPSAPPPAEEPPPLIDRDAVPVQPNEKEGVLNPDDVYIPQADAGRVGEVTAETALDKDAGIYNPDPDALTDLPSGATGGTPIGVGSIGHHGLGTSAFASRKAGGGGRGGGGFGQGGGGGKGGVRTTEAAVMAALEWLKNHQSPDGRWDAEGFQRLCKKNTCDGAGSSSHDVGVTGLALLCFLGAGETHATGSYKETVKRGLKYLLSVQDEDGCFGQRVGQSFLYDHACAALAITEAYGMTQARPFKEPAQLAISFILRAQNRYAAWRYAYPPNGDNDMSVTGWMLMVLKSGKIGGLEIDDEAFNSALAWIDEMTDPETGRSGYTDRGSSPSRLPEVLAKFPPDRSESTTAIAVLSRIFGGRTLETDPMIAKGADLMNQKPPKWNTATGDIDFYYWYYATLAMFQVGGQRWEKWNEAMKTAVLDHQRINPAEDEFGSWDPLDPWSTSGGRVYSTALNCLCMEVYYRYPRVFGTGKRRRGQRKQRYQRAAGARSAAPGPKRTLLALAVVALCAADARASDEKKLLAKDDLLFARELARRGYSDLAAEILAAVEHAKSGGAEGGLGARVLRLDLAEDAARRETDPRKRIAALEQVAQEKEKLVQDSEPSEARDDLQARLPDLYQSIGEQFAALLLGGPPPREAQALRTQGQEMFKTALRALHARQQALIQKRDKQPPGEPDPELEHQYMLVSYGLARTYYFQSLVLEPGSEPRQSSLRTTLELLLDFQLDFADQLAAYEGLIYEGLAHAELGEPGEALDSFDGAIRLLDFYEQGSDGAYALPPEAANIVSAAVLQKMLLLSTRGDERGVLAAADQFAKSVADPVRTLKGPAILIREAEAYRTLGDKAAFEKAARRLVELDPRGVLGERGRELLRESGGGSLDVADTLRLAEAAAARGQGERAIELAREILSSAAGKPGSADAGAQAGLLLGAVLAQRGALVEAVVAWESAADAFPASKQAPECLWRAIQGHLTLNSRTPSTAHREHARDSMAALAKHYPEHPYASMAAIIEGQQLEQERKYAEAAARFERIPAGSPGYAEALYRAGSARSLEAGELQRAQRKAEAASALEKSETLLRDSIPALEQSAAETLERTTRDRMLEYAFAARIALANLLVLGGAERAEEVAPLFAGIEKRYPDDANKLAAVQRVRIRAAQALGRTDEALALLDAELAKNPGAKGMAGSAAELARVLDERGVELASQDPESNDADRAWRKAANYYSIAVQAEGSAAQVLALDEIEAIADRLFALALRFNGVPPEVESFADGPGRRPEPEMLERAAQAYQAALALGSRNRVLINYARTLGFLGRWNDAATRYVELFDKEVFEDLGARTIDRDALRAKPELLSALLEWGVCEREASTVARDDARLARAASIFETLVLNTSEDGRVWWLAKYYQLLVLNDRGEYGLADIALRSLQRNWPDYDEGRFQLAERFTRLGEELSKKVSR